MEDNNKTIQLFDVKVIFADLEDRGFGRNIVIDATDEATQAAISIWCKDNNIPLIRIPYTHYKELKIEDLLLETSKFKI